MAVTLFLLLNIASTAIIYIVLFIVYPHKISSYKHKHTYIHIPIHREKGEKEMRALETQLNNDLELLHY